jgi:hypothetical protein
MLFGDAALLREARIVATRGAKHCYAEGRKCYVEEQHCCVETQHCYAETQHCYADSEGFLRGQRRVPTRMAKGSCAETQHCCAEGEHCCALTERCYTEGGVCCTPCSDVCIQRAALRRGGCSTGTESIRRLPATRTLAFRHDGPQHLQGRRLSERVSHGHGDRPRVRPSRSSI